MTLSEYLRKYLTHKETYTCTGASQTMATHWRNGKFLPSVPNWYLLAYKIAEKRNINYLDVLDEMGVLI